MSNPQFKIHLWDLNVNAVDHLVPEGAVQVSVEIIGARSFTEGYVRLMWVGRKPDGTLHKRRTAKEWRLSEDWFYALCGHRGVMHSLGQALDTKLQERLAESEKKHQAEKARTRAAWDALTPEQQAAEIARREAKYEADKKVWEAEQAALAASANEIQSAAAGQPGLQA